MIRQLRTIRGVVILLALLLSAPLFPPIHAQDTFDSDPRKRNTSAAPTYHGIIVDGIYPALSNTSDFVNSGSRVKAITEFGAEAYYDSWQIGVQKKNYGTLGILSFKTATPDIYQGAKAAVITARG